MNNYIYLLILLGIVIGLCLLLNRVTVRFKIPSLLLFIALGVVFGVLFRIAGLGNFTDYELGNVVCSVCLVFVIFYGGFNTNFKEARPVLGRAVVLSLAGTALTAGLIGVFVYIIFLILPFGPIGWLESMLIGAVLCSTDAASVFNILRSRRLNLKYHTSSLLEMESGSNDPMSYMLTAVLVAVLSSKYALSGTSLSGFEIAGMFVFQIGVGTLFGIGTGVLAAVVLKKVSFNMGQGGTIFVIAVALISFALPQILPGIFAGNGYLSVYLCGIIVGNARIPKKRDCVHFFDALTGVAQMMIFFLLGLLATPEHLVRPQVLLPALLIFVTTTIIARPLSVAVLLMPFRAKANQIALVGWAGLRGVASVVFAAVAVSNLGENTLPYDLFSIVFCVVLFSILLQGSFLPLLSKKFNMLGDHDDVLRTFNDYQEETDVSFVKIEIGENHPWYGKKLKNTVMPKEFLVVLILRGGDVFVPDGETRIVAGDVLVTAAPEFENREDFGMYEEFIGKNHHWCGVTVKDLQLPESTLVAMIKRGAKAVVPNGSTVIEENDTLALIRIKGKTEPARKISQDRSNSDK